MLQSSNRALQYLLTVVKQFEQIKDLFQGKSLSEALGTLNTVLL